MESRVKVKVIKPEQGYVDNNPPPALANLLRATGPGIIIYLAERYGLRRMPGLSPAALADRLLRELSQEQLLALYNDLIAAHFGAYTIDGLLQLILNTKATTGSQLPPPNLADMPPAEAVLVEHREKRWWFTMHGYDVIIDLNHRYLACNCHYFRFSSWKGFPCKHIACGLKLIPPAAAREALIDLLVSRKYGGPDVPGWQFRALDPAA